MAQTPLSTSTPYCSAADLFVYHDEDQVGDMLRTGGNSRPSLASMLTADEPLDANRTPIGRTLRRFLMVGSGQVESTCLIGRRYVPEDLQALTGASLETLVKLVADLCFWALCKRRQPNASDPRNVPGAMEAVETLKALRDGETVFGFEETADAGLPDVVPARPWMLVTPNAVARAYRIFPLAEINIQEGRGD